MTDANSSHERILFLYLPTGGGHLSTARALAREVENNYSPDQVTAYVLDGMENNSPELRAFVEKGYTYVSVKIPFLWKILWKTSNSNAIMRLQTDLMRSTTTGFLAQFIEENKITRIVILHFLLYRPVVSALKRLGKVDLPLVTVVTDPFSLHPIWSFQQEHPMLVFSEKARLTLEKQLNKPRALFSKKDNDPPMLKIVEPIIDSRFSTPLSEAQNQQNRSDQGFATDKKLVLLAGGGDGLPRGLQVLRKLAASADDFQIAMVCGKNKAQFQKALAIKEKYPHKNIKIYGFVRIMYELMNMADVVVAKGGPATIFEVLSLRKPLFIASYFYGQEQGNVDFVVENGLGWYDSSATRLAQSIVHLLKHPLLFQEVSERLSKQVIGNGTAEVIRQVLKL